MAAVTNVNACTKKLYIILNKNLRGDSAISCDENKDVSIRASRMGHLHNHTGAGEKIDPAKTIAVMAPTRLITAKEPEQIGSRLVCCTIPWSLLFQSYDVTALWRDHIAEIN